MLEPRNEAADRRSRSGYVPQGDEDNEMDPLVSSFTHKRPLVKRLAVALVVVLVIGCVLSVSLVLTLRDGGATHRRPQPSRAQHGMVSTDNANCSHAGVRILQEEGGNAVDAAIASALCIGLVHAHSSGIGGGGIMLIRAPNGTAWALDSRESAPASASQDMYVEDPSLAVTGPLAIAVPGELRGMYEAHRRWGRASWASLFAPTIEMAEQGFHVSEPLGQAIALHEHEIREDPGMSQVYAPGGVLVRTGDLLTRPRFAQTLRTIAQDGNVESFYSGAIADNMLADISAVGGGILTKADLINYEVTSRDPIHTYHQGHRVIGVPPPFGSAVSMLAMNVFESYNLGKLHAEGQRIMAQHWLVEGLKFGYADRMALGDPLYVANVSNVIVPQMLSKEHAAFLRQRLSPNTTFEPEHYKDLEELTAQLNDHGTTHISVVDKDRMAVAFTSTINTYFGSKVLSPSTGVQLNNEMDDFSSPGTPNSYGYPPSEANFIAPGKRPLSSMTPTIVERDGEVWLVVGASGGSKIITSVLQVLLNCLLFDMNVAEAIYAPRLHDQLIPDSLQLEPEFSRSIASGLAAMNYTLDWRNSHFAVVQAVMVMDDGSLEGAADWRKAGDAVGY